MIEIDGSQGEGGGQVLRTSVAMSALSGQTVHIKNIRAGRKEPGLRPQHLKAVEAISLLCDGEENGLRVGSTELTFRPCQIKARRLMLDVGTAGSATLVLQALLPVALSAPGEVTVEVSGGTDVRWAPTADYFKHIFCMFLKRIGCSVEFDVLERGFYPEGGGRVRLSVLPWRHRRVIQVMDMGEMDSLGVFSVSSEQLRERHVAERQVHGFLKKMAPHHLVESLSTIYLPSRSTGSSFLAYADYRNTRLGACVIGDRGLRAEDVGLKAAEDLLSEMASKAPLDSHMADQIIPYLALAGGSVRASKISGHTRTNIDVVNSFGYGLKMAEDNTISSDGPGVAANAQKGP